MLAWRAKVSEESGAGLGHSGSWWGNGHPTRLRIIIALQEFVPCRICPIFPFFRGLKSWPMWSLLVLTCDQPIIFWKWSRMNRNHPQASCGPWAASLQPPCYGSWHPALPHAIFLFNLSPCLHCFYPLLLLERLSVGWCLLPIVWLPLFFSTLVRINTISIPKPMPVALTFLTPVFLCFGQVKATFSLCHPNYCKLTFLSNL